ncbi:transposase [Proteus faecis]|nr:transposase [Proteus faecis]
MVCPSCGVVHGPYKIQSRKQYRCKHCNHTFSITSGTMFANHKLPTHTREFG